MQVKKKKTNQNKWFTVPRELVQRSILKGNLLIVYNILAALADSHQRVSMTFHQIAKKSGLSNVETLKILYKLEELHLICSEPSNEKTELYRLLLFPVWEKECEKLKLFSPPYRIGISNNIKKFDTDIDQIINQIFFQKTMNKIEDAKLAYELAEALNDKEAIQMYIAYVNRFPESLLRETLVKVLSVPENKIRKSRGALFNYLIQQHATKTKYYSGD